MHVVDGSIALLGPRIARRHRDHGVRVLSGSRRTGVDPTASKPLPRCSPEPRTAWKEARHVGHART